MLGWIFVQGPLPTGIVHIKLVRSCRETQGNVIPV